MNRFAFCAMSALLLGACGQAPESSPAFDDLIEQHEQALASQASVFGFENAAEWNSTQGTKTASTDRSQGAASLALSNFTFTSVTSVPLGTITGVASSISLDVKLPATVGWGQVQLFVSIPSRNVYEASLGQVSLAGLPAGSFQSLKFSVPAAVVQALQGTYSDLRFKVTVTAPQTSQNVLLDNLRFSGQSTVAQKVEIEVTGVDDFVYASVDGLRRQVWTINDPWQNTRLDISDWFGAGSHALRLQAINTGGPVGYGVRVWADNVLVLDAQCPATLCDGTDKDHGILFDQTLQLSTTGRPAMQTVQVTSSTAGKLYINNAFTGITTSASAPTTVSLPPDTYTFGLGVSDDVPPVYTGQYHEQQVVLGSAPVSIDLTSTPPLPFQDATRMVIVPIRRLITSSTNQEALLTSTDISDFQAQVAATRDQWFEPFSYGLATWDVDFHPVVENVPVYAHSNEGGPDTDTFLEDAGLESLRQDYEVVVYYFSIYDSAGTQLPVDGSAWGGGGQVWINTFWTRRSDWPRTGPNPALNHEVLHNTEGYNRWNLGFYNGIESLHGTRQHGYSENAELDFAWWQRDYMRGQVAEVVGMRQNLNWPSVPATADLWVGVFDTIRRGYNPAPPAPPAPEALAARAAFGGDVVTSPAGAVKCPPSSLDATTALRSVP